MPSKLIRGLRLFAINLVVLAVLAIGMEGVTSSFLFILDVLKTKSVAEQQHSQYDPDLGWRHVPNKKRPNMYGPGLSLTINSQGFRSRRDFDRSVPAGMFRIICSGDSFTLGYGVNDDETYCQQLTKLNPKIETINMGQGGYGLDQAYLWYKRDGTPFDHQLQILAFITDDFYRMQYDTFRWAYGKPKIEIENDKMVVKNVPVSETSYRFSWITNHIESLRQLRTYQLLKRIRNALRPAPVESPAPPPSKTVHPNEMIKKVVRRMLEELKEFHQKRSSQLMLVYFPIPEELSGPPPQEWMTFIKAETKRLQIPFVNVVDAFQSLPANEWEGLYIPKGQMTYPAAAGHFNKEGNKRVAEIIYKELQKDSIF